VGRVIKAAGRRGDAVPAGEHGNRGAALLIRARAAAESIFSRERERIVELAMIVATRIAGRALDADPALIDGVYERALDGLGELPPREVRVHPEDRPLSRVDAMAEGKGFVVIEDPSVGRGGCRVAAEGAEIDASLDAVLGALRDAMLGGARG